MIIPTSLRNRFIATLAITFLVVLAALTYVFEYVMVPALRLEEEQQARYIVDQIQEKIDDELTELDVLGRQWATSDEAYHFMTGMPSSFTTRHLNSILFRENGLTLVLLIDRRDKVSWVAGIDPASDTFTSCPAAVGKCRWAKPFAAGFQANLSRQKETFLHHHQQIMTTPLPAMFSQRPLLHSDASGPRAGTLIMARAMSTDWINQLHRALGVEIALKDTIASPSLPASMLTVDYLDDTRVRAALRRPAQPERHQLLIEVMLSLDQLHGGIAKYRLALLITVGLLALVMLVALLAFCRMVLKPLSTLTDYAQHLRREGSEERVPNALLDRQDEIGVMVREFQDVIDYLDERMANFETLSYTDALTQLGNRRQVDERLPQILSLTHRLEHPVALILLDVDHFKAFNDHYGHPAGDACLKALAATLADLFQRESDLVARIGGEEFLVVLPDIGPDRAAEIADGIRTAVEAQHILHAASPSHCHVTVSVGVVVSQPSQRQTLCAEALIKAADESLYEAKRHGRNKTGRLRLLVD